HHISPEYYLARRNFISDSMLDPRKIDSWALGVTLLRLTNNQYRPRGKHPFCFEQVKEHCRSYEDYEKILNSIPKLDTPPRGSIWELIRSLLSPNPRDRPTPQEALLNYSCLKQDNLTDVQAYLKDFVEHQRRGAFTKNMLSAFQTQLLRKSDSKSYIPRLLPLLNTAKYINRPKLEREILESLISSENNITVLKGGGGMGKSELATYIIYHPDVQSHFKQIYWFSSA
ncbi:hypothetical protein GR268_43370, partial [Rhizobium leguminosarum]|nr:hypothetical protein [Rhizobium leguminosarum]